MKVTEFCCHQISNEELRMQMIAKSSAALMLVAIASCTGRSTDAEPPSTNPSRAIGAEPGAQPSAMPSTAYRTECKPIDGQSDSCANLLPDKWTDLKHPANSQAQQDQLRALDETLSSLANDGLQADEDTQLRRVDQGPGCETTDNFRIRYRAPKAMLEFPSDGTGSRDLVVGYFTPDPDAKKTNCAERKFAFLNPGRDEGEGFVRVHQFLAVNVAMKPDTGDGTRDVKIGKWSSWSLARKGSGNSAKYKLRELKPVDHSKPEDHFYWWCSAKHGGKNVQYLTCNAQRMMMAAVRAGKVSTLDDAFDRYQRRDTTFLKEAGIDRSRMIDDGAWARCGNLGCCVSM